MAEHYLRSFLSEEESSGIYSAEAMFRVGEEPVVYGYKVVDKDKDPVRKGLVFWGTGGRGWERPQWLEKPEEVRGSGAAVQPSVELTVAVQMLN